ncbi:hypothetical protein HN615_12730 [Candidatus Woesearchaeota archaeon]|nr:hypothetical protein [Candidatus Woesearchaeota archaeon]
MITLKEVYLLQEREDFTFIASEIIKYYKSKVPPGIKINTTRYKDDTLKGDYNVDKNTIQIRTSYTKVSDFMISVLHEIKHAMDAKKKGKKNYKLDYEWEMNYQIGNGKHQYRDNKYEIEAEKWAKSEYSKRWKNKF